MGQIGIIKIKSGLKMSLDGFFEKNTGFVLDTLKTNGRFEAALFVLDRDKKVSYYGINDAFENGQTKTFFYEAVLPALLREEQAVAHMLASEAWYVSRTVANPEEAKNIHVIASEEPDRQTILIIHRETAVSDFSKFYIQENGKVVLHQLPGEGEFTNVHNSFKGYLHKTFRDN